MLVLHISIALSSLLYTTYLYLWPSAASFKPAYLMITATLATGTYLVTSTGEHLLRACTAGLIYLSVVTALLALARRKLNPTKTTE